MGQPLGGIKMNQEKTRAKYCPKVEREEHFQIISIDANNLKIKKCDGMYDCGVVSGPDLLWSKCYFMQHKDELREIYEKPYREK